MAKHVIPLLMLEYEPSFISRRRVTCLHRVLPDSLMILIAPCLPEFLACSHDPSVQDSCDSPIATKQFRRFLLHLGKHAGIAETLSMSAASALESTGGASVRREVLRHLLLEHGA